MTNGSLMKVESIAECSKLPYVIKIFVLSIFEWLFYSGFTVTMYVTKSPHPNGAEPVCQVL